MKVEEKTLCSAVGAGRMDSTVPIDAAETKPDAWKI
jgi:hypothetical protein